LPAEWPNYKVACPAYNLNRRERDDGDEVDDTADQKRYPFCVLQCNTFWGNLSEDKGYKANYESNQEYGYSNRIVGDDSKVGSLQDRHQSLSNCNSADCRSKESYQGNANLDRSHEARWVFYQPLHCPCSPAAFFHKLPDSGAPYGYKCNL